MANLWEAKLKLKLNENTNFIPKYFVLSLRIKQLHIEIHLSNKYAIFNQRIRKWSVILCNKCLSFICSKSRAEISQIINWIRINLICIFNHCIQSCTCAFFFCSYLSYISQALLSFIRKSKIVIIFSIIPPKHLLNRVSHARHIDFKPTASSFKYTSLAIPQLLTNHRPKPSF